MSGEHVPAERMRGPSVEFREIVTIRSEEPVLARLRLRLQAGTVTVLMGPSGSGKTTLVRHLVGLLPPDSGTILVGDRQVWELPQSELAELRKSFGVLLGGSTLFDSSVFSSFTVLDNVAYPLRLAGLDEELVAQLAARQLEEFDLTDVAELMPNELAARVRRRVALAAVLVADRHLVVLDDPDLGMDKMHVEKIVHSILQAHARTRATFLITTHDVSLARALGQHLAILVNGRIVAEGDPATLLYGVEDGEEFDRRFRIMDYIGPPDLETLRATREKQSRVIVFDPLMLMLFAVIAVMFVMLILVGKLAPGPFWPGS